MDIPTLKTNEGRDLDFSDTGISVQPVIGYRVGQVVTSANNQCEVIEHAGRLHLKRLYPQR